MNPPLKTRVALVVPGGIGTGKDNIGVPVLNEIVELLSKDIDVTVFSFFKVNKNFKAKGFELVDVSGGPSFSKFYRFLRSFSSHHAKRKYDAIHGFWAAPCGFVAVAAGMIFKVKSVVSVLGGDAVSLPEIHYGQLGNRIKRRLIFWTLKNANVVALLTHFLSDKLREAGFQRTAMRVIPWGVDQSVFSYAPHEKSEQLQFLHVADLSPVKDQETLLKAFRIIRNDVSAFLTIIGGGILEKEIRELIVSLGLQNDVGIRPQVPYHALSGFYQASDILLHTSLFEGQSEVVTEAMSSGVLVCGTRVGLIADEQECCLSADVGDPDQLAKMVLTAIKDPDSVAAIKEKARAWTSAHDLAWTVLQYKELYR